MQDIETYLQLRGAQVLHYGPGGFSTAIADLVFPNGINVSPDGRTVYVAAVTWRSVLVYDRDPATDALDAARLHRHRQRRRQHRGRRSKGQLWIGAHPKLLAVPKHAADPDQPGAGAGAARRPPTARPSRRSTSTTASPSPPPASAPASRTDC